MAFRIRVKVDYDWVPDGAGGGALGQQQADDPGYGASQLAGAVGAAQTASDLMAEIVAGGDSPANTDFQDALNAAAADLYTRFTTAGAVPGFNPTGTLYSTVAGWSSGNP